jgi:hypothetical protein
MISRKYPIISSYTVVKTPNLPNDINPVKTASDDHQLAQDRQREEDDISKGPNTAQLSYIDGLIFLPASGLLSTGGLQRLSVFTTDQNQCILEFKRIL